MVVSINPNMLTLAREIKGLTQIELAERIGVTQGILSKIELGLVGIKDDTLTKISEVLSFPKKFFTQEGNLYEPNLYYRKKYKTSRKILSRAKAEMNLYRLGIQHFLKCIELDTPEIPNFDVDSHGTPQTIAKKLREFWSIPKGPIKNLVTLLESKGIFIVLTDFESEDISGSGMFTSDKIPIIYVNKSMPMCRQRFTICHELFHVISHVFFSVDETRDIEKEANLFAGEFLMPESEIRTNLVGKLTIAKLADLKRYWLTSMSAILTRAKQINSITERHAKTLYIEMGKLGFRKNEPKELEPPKEIPALLKLLFDTLKNELGFSEEEIANTLCLDIDYVLTKFYEPERARLKVRVHSNLKVA